MGDQCISDTRYETRRETPSPERPPQHQWRMTGYSCWERTSENGEHFYSVIQTPFHYLAIVLSGIIRFTPGREGKTHVEMGAEERG